MREFRREAWWRAARRDVVEGDRPRCAKRPSYIPTRRLSATRSVVVRVGSKKFSFGLSIAAVLGTLLPFIRFLGMGEQAEKCRRKAVECESTALHSPDEAMRLAYLELAQLWRQIAAQAETLDRSNPEASVEQH